MDIIIEVRNAGPECESRKFLRLAAWAAALAGAWLLAGSSPSTKRGPLTEIPITDDVAVIRTDFSDRRAKN